MRSHQRAGGKTARGAAAASGPARGAAVDAAHASAEVSGASSEPLDWSYSLIGDVFSASSGSTDYTITDGVGFDTDWRVCADGELVGVFGTRRWAEEAAQRHANLRRDSEPDEHDRSIEHLRAVVASYQKAEPYRNEPPRSYDEAKRARAELNDRYGIQN